MKELITGASGFIGNNLAERLKRSGHQVVRLSLRNETFNREIDKFKPDNIFHLAAYGSQAGENDPNEMVNVNIYKSCMLMEAALFNKVKSIILCGSSSEYGINKWPMSEDSLLRPDSFYAASKVAMSMMARAFAKETDLHVVTLRPFSVYGPGERDTRFIPTVIRSCLTGEPMKLCPEQNHDWIYIDDLVEGFLVCSDYAHDLRGEVVNFGLGIQVTNQVVLETIQELMGKKANVTERLFPKPQDSKMWVANINRATSLGWRPQTNLVRGLYKTIQFYESKYGTKRE